MFGILRYGIVFALAFFAVAVAAIGWPRFTARERPPVLTQIARQVELTPVGTRISDVLGVNTDQIEPLDLKAGSQAVAYSAAGLAGARLRTIFISWVARQLESQSGYLSDPAYDEIRRVICLPPDSSPSAATAVSGN